MGLLSAKIYSFYYIIIYYMNILFSSTATIDCCNGDYFNNSVKAALPRYHRLGKNITCLAFFRNVDSPNQEKIDDPNVKFVFLHKVNSIYSLLFKRSENLSVIEEEVKRADACVIHVPSFIGDEVAKLANKYNKPYMTVVVGCPWDAYWNYNFKGKLIAPFRYLSLKNVQKYAPYSIYVTSHFLQNRYPSNGFQIGCSDVNIENFDNSVVQRRMNFINRKNKIVKIVTIAAVDVRYKGQEYVIKALGMLKKQGYLFEYHMIGAGNIDFLHSMAIKCDVNSQVFFHGALPHSKIFSLLDEMDIYIQPSKQEGLPRAVIEAMSRGCLCLGTNVAGIPELLDEKYIFKKGCVNDIISIIKRITLEDYLQQAIRNFDESRKYNTVLLDSKRNDFIDKFKVFAENEKGRNSTI